MRPRQLLQRAATVVLFLFFVGGGLAGNFASAEDWMYRRSYYSHTLTPEAGAVPNHPLPEHRSAYRPAYYREAFGFSARSAFRINNYVIRNGPRTDRTIYMEGYFELQP